MVPKTNLKMLKYKYFPSLLVFNTYFSITQQVTRNQQRLPSNLNSTVTATTPLNNNNTHRLNLRTHHPVTQCSSNNNSLHITTSHHPCRLQRYHNNKSSSKNNRHALSSVASHHHNHRMSMSTRVKQTVHALKLALRHNAPTRVHSDMVVYISNNHNNSVLHQQFHR